MRWEFVSGLRRRGLTPSYPHWKCRRKILCVAKVTHCGNHVQDRIQLLARLGNELDHPTRLLDLRLGRPRHKAGLYDERLVDPTLPQLLHHQFCPNS